MIKASAGNEQAPNQKLPLSNNPQPNINKSSSPATSSKTGLALLGRGSPGGGRNFGPAKFPLPLGPRAPKSSVKLKPETPHPKLQSSPPQIPISKTTLLQKSPILQFRNQPETYFKEPNPQSSSPNDKNPQFTNFKESNFPVQLPNQFNNNLQRAKPQSKSEREQKVPDRPNPIQRTQLPANPERELTSHFPATNTFEVPKASAGNEQAPNQKLPLSNNPQPNINKSSSPATSSKTGLALLGRGFRRGGRNFGPAKFPLPLGPRAPKSSVKQKPETPHPNLQSSPPNGQNPPVQQQPHSREPNPQSSSPNDENLQFGINQFQRVQLPAQIRKRTKSPSPTQPHSKDPTPTATYFKKPQFLVQLSNDQNPPSKYNPRKT